MQNPYNPPPVPPPGDYPPSPPQDNKKIAAGVCGILLGFLGIHKFILGYNTEGIIMLLVSVLGAWFTCGFSAYAMGAIGLVEGILYLVKSDQEFHQTYVVNQRPWF